MFETKQPKKGRARKPLTTREKIEAAEAKKAGQSQQHRSKRPTLLESLARLQSSYEQDNRHLSVLYRPTERAKRDSATLLSSSGPQKDDGNTGKNLNPSKPFPLLSLPQEVLVQIWEECVVEKEAFIWPAKPLGAEQPDLAMTCRAIREEVLPIFYGQNIFAVDVTIPPGTTLEMLTIPREESDESDVETDLKPHALFYRWARVVEGSGHLASIRKWVFDYSPTNSSDGGESIAAGVTQDLMVFLQISEDDERSYARAEVHRDAMCLNASLPDCGQCKTNPLPGWLQKLVDAVSLEAGMGNGRWVVMGMFATCLMACAGKLVESRCEQVTSRCEEVMPSVEMEQ